MVAVFLGYHRWCWHYWCFFVSVHHIGVLVVAITVTGVFWYFLLEALSFVMSYHSESVHINYFRLF
ncbi:1898_t:CDS:2 [Gigaspora rosea]|nr:1898_t:CDS:2 [Gigaspora rosea]